MTRSPHRLTIVLALMAIPQAVFAQSMDVRTITRTVADGVCAPFIRSGDIVAARRAAEALGYRPTGEDAGVAGAVEMAKPHGGRLVLGLQPGSGLCSIGMAEAAVRQIEEAASPTLRSLGLRRDRGGGEGVSVIWRGDRVEAVAAPSARDTPGSALTFRFTPPDRGDAG